jgi:putative endonuclease
MGRYFVYAIKSRVNDRIYVGISKDLKRRLIEHNKGYTRSTKAFIPWKIIYQKYCGSRKEARKEEKRLKSGAGKEFLKSIKD